MTFQIEKNVPLPTKTMYPFMEMHVGDSVLIPGKKRQSVAMAIHNAQLRTGARFATRQTDDGVRVWRTH
jgi:hypothetical protein